MYLYGLCVHGVTGVFVGKTQFKLSVECNMLVVENNDNA